MSKLAPDYPHEFDDDYPDYRTHTEPDVNSESLGWFAVVIIGTIFGIIAAFALVLKWSLT